MSKRLALYLWLDEHGTWQAARQPPEGVSYAIVEAYGDIVALNAFRDNGLLIKSVSPPE